MIMKKSEIVAILTFFSICLIPLALTNTKKNVVSQFDNRKLMEWSDVGESNFQSMQIENYLHDRIGFRETLITLDQIWNAAIFGKLTHPLYDFGKDEYVFFRFDDDYQWEEDTYISLFASVLDRMNQYCEAGGTDFRVMINPSKEIVYSEYLPAGVHYKDKNMEVLFSQFDTYGIKYTYTGNELILAKKNTAVFNRKYDAGHWNDAGAFVGIRKLLIDLSSDGFDIQIPDEDWFYQKKVLKKYLLNSRFPINETVEDWLPYEPKTIKDESYDEAIGQIISPLHPHFECRKNIINTQAPRILIFRGSYLENRMKFYSDVFSESLDIIGYDNISRFDQFYQMFKPDIVVFETADYAVSEVLYPSQVLYEALDTIILNS